MVRFDQPCHSTKGALTYFRTHMAKGDYLTQGGQLQMKWVGQGATRLGLTGTVEPEHFSRLCAGQHPITGQKLTVREKTNRRVCFFAQMSVPKDVSIACLVGGDKRIERWWQEAVQETLGEIEAAVETRVRAKGKKDEDRITGNMVAAVVTHDASRALDPQLHTHLCVMNVTYDPVEKRWKGVQPSNFYRYQAFFREVSYNKLAQRMREGGYELEPAEGIGFNIKGFPPELRKKFSKRRDEILEKASELGIKSQKGLQAVTSNTRAEKKQLTAADLRDSWIKECGESYELIQRIIEATKVGPVTRTETGPGEAMDYAEEHLFERQSVVTDRFILQQALVAGRSAVELEQLRAELERRVCQGTLVRHEDEITSRLALAMESELIHWARSDWDKYPRMGDERAINPELKGEHREAVRELLRCRNRMIVFQGDAGTGKTSSLKEVVKGIKAAGGGVFACAPSSKATAELRDDLVPDAETIQYLLVNRHLQQKIAGRIIIVDEAGLLSVRQMRDLARLANANNNRLILVGDVKQHRSVEAGDALRAVQKYCEVKTVRLTKIHRQTDPAYRKVVEFLAAKQPYAAFGQLEKLGAIRELKSPLAMFDRAAENYVQTITSGKSCLAIAPVWSEIAMFTGIVREKLKAKDLIRGDEREIRVTSSFGWTTAQRKRVENYKPGHVLQFHRETAAFAKNEAVTMVGIRDHRLVVERDNGVRWAFDPKRVHDFDVGEARKISIAAGERLLMKGNLKSVGIKNGDIGEVVGFDADGSIKLKDGRMIPPSFRQFTHGYATTSHASQGRTVDSGILILGDAGIRAANLQQAYVSNSRFRKWQTVYTTDAKAAKNAMANDSDRKLAHELREKRIRQWRIIEGLVADGEAWRAVRNRVIAARQGAKVSVNPGGIGYAA